MAVAKTTGLPIIEGVHSADDMPHILSYAIMHRVQIDSFNELPKDKRPPRDLWSKPYKLEQFFDTLFDSKGSSSKREYIDLDLEEVE